ncbi:unnamed protein product [Caenorhabditis auriculariae]|uniref:protein O-GlcNAcase n=1 Tax=Caenorhabditis auriculariae TaxID=2777116 RepID=A0A8S1H2T5_9PELO|nr:unnamed protein product [Caenorhabditis auriculariae]
MESEASSCAAATIFAGVAEGFYGRPWTFEQRKHLFGRLNRLGLNTYMYAPKDDIKHRSNWRELYNDEEISILGELVSAAKENNIIFIYALSPGLDIGYSNPEEVEKVKKKFEQVKNVGCTSFALLFDDIEPKMKPADQEKFETFADAHVAVTNSVYEYLNPDHFQFCPTEYSESRTIPKLKSSVYLNTIGEKLHKSIDIFWTGPHVVSRELTVEHLIKVGKVFRRKPFIWDNLHASDYDPKRIFMGPFKGRSVLIKNHISGLLSNPNCKYEVNFVPFNTMADWFHCVLDSNDDEEEEMIQGEELMFYNPEKSAQAAIATWMHEFHSVNGPSIPPIPKIDENIEGADLYLEKQKAQLANGVLSQENSFPLEEIIQTLVAPEIAEQNSIVNSLSADYAQPMEQDESPIPEEDELVENVENSSDAGSTTNRDKIPTIKHINMLIDLFYLPFANGRGATRLYEEFAWLYENGVVMRTNDDAGFKNKAGVIIKKEDWLEHYKLFFDMVQAVVDIFAVFSECTNKTLVSDLIPFVWEAHGVLMVLLGVIRWIRSGQLKVVPDPVSAFWYCQIDKEPWSSARGLFEDCIRLLARDQKVMDLFRNKILLPLSIVTYDIRPCFSTDANLIRELGMEKNSEMDMNKKELQGELFVERDYAPFLQFGSEYNFICEEIVRGVTDTRRPICFAVAHSNGSLVQENLPLYLERSKRMFTDNCLKDHTTVGDWFPRVAADIFIQYPAWLNVRFDLDPFDAVPMRRLVQAVCVTLAMNEVKGVFCPIPVSETDRLQFFLRIGFKNLGLSECEKFVLVGLKIFWTIFEKEEPVENTEDVEESSSGSEMSFDILAK